MSLLLILMVLGVTVSGCGNVESGVEGGPGPTGTPPAGDDDDDDDGSGYDPGPMPATCGGMAVFGLARGNVNDFSGMITFFPIEVPLPPTFADVWNNYPDIAIDTCKEVFPSSVGLSSNIENPSAGDVSLEGPNGIVAFTPMMGMGWYIALGGAMTAYVPNSPYLLKASGGQIPAFTHSLSSPGVTTSLSPDVSGTTPLVIPRGQPLQLRWESIKDGDPVYFMLHQQWHPEAQDFMWMCKIKDDGEFDVPVAMLQSYDPTVLPFPTETWRDKMEFRRMRVGSFHPQGAVGPILTSFDSGWYADVQLQ